MEFISSPPESTASAPRVPLVPHTRELYHWRCILSQCTPDTASRLCSSLQSWWSCLVKLISITLTAHHLCSTIFSMPCFNSIHMFSFSRLSAPVADTSHLITAHPLLVSALQHVQLFKLGWHSNIILQHTQILFWYTLKYFLHSWETTDWLKTCVIHCQVLSRQECRIWWVTLQDKLHYCTDTRGQVSWLILAGGNYGRGIVIMYILHSMYLN